MAQSENPFAPPSGSNEPPPTSSRVSPVPLRKLRKPTVSLALWTLVCVVSAGPSFFWGIASIASKQLWAMLLGVGIFIAIYTLADQATQSRPWRHISPIPLTLKIGYATRIVISIVFPIGIILDLMCGFFSVGIVQAVLPLAQASRDGTADSEGSTGFLGALLITLVQGVVLNIVLFGYMSVVFGIIMAFRLRRPRNPND